MNDVLPVALWRPAGTRRLVIRMPPASDNRIWLYRNLGTGIRPDWNKNTQRWEIARSHFRALVEALTERFGTIDVFIDSRATARCDTRCRDAEGDECGCQCLGENHGGAAYWRDWQLVSDTTLVAADGVTRRHLRVAAVRIPAGTP